MNDQTPRRPGIVTVLALGQFLSAPVFLLMAIGLSRLGAGPYAIGAGAVMGVLTIVELLCGMGLWRMKAFGRSLQIALAWIGLLLFPVGTICGILILLYLRKPGVRELFAGKPITEFSQEELRHLAPMGRESGIVAALIGGAAVVGSFFVLSIVAAVAVPGLLSAKMAANEAAAISTLRQVAAEEASYALTCGNGAFTGSFKTLAVRSLGVRDRPGADVTTIDSAEEFGFLFVLQAGAGSIAGPKDCQGRPTVTAWYLTAAPQMFGNTARHSYATNANAAIWASDSAVAPGEPFGPPAVIVR